MFEPKVGINRFVFALFLVLVFSLGFMKPSVDSVLTAMTPTDIAFPLVLICWLVAIVVGAYTFRWHPAFLAFVLYFVALLISSIFSTNPLLSFEKLSGEVYLILLAVLTANVVTTSSTLKLSFFAWIAGASVPMLIGIFAILLFYLSPENVWLTDITYHHGAVPMGNFPRVSSTFISASMFCNYLTVTQIMTLISARLGWLNEQLAILLTIAIAICSIFTVSIALGGFFLMLGIWISATGSHSIRARLALVLGGIIAVAFLVIAPFSLGPLVTETVGPSSRLLVWIDASKTFFENPIAGKGLGTAAANVIYQNSDGTFSLLTDAHNTFLNVAVQSGIIGLLGLLTVIFVLLRSGLSKFTGNAELSVLRVGLATAFLSAFVYDGLTGSFENARHLWVLMGLMLAADRISTNSAAADRDS